MMSPKAAWFLRIVLCTIFLNTWTLAQEVPRASSAVLDLRSWEFSADEPLDLTGEWAFFWQALYEPDAIPEAESFVDIPTIWNNYQVDNSAVGATGFATYQLTVLVDPQTEDLTLLVPLIYSSYALWLNGELISQAGELGTSLADYQSAVITRHVPLDVNSDKLEFVLQIANFHFRHGGLASPLSLGPASAILPTFYLNQFRIFFLMGCFLILGVYHFIIYALRPNIYPTLVFGILCVVVAIFIAPRYYPVTVEATPWLTFPWRLKLEYLSAFMILPLGYLFSHLLYPQEIRRSVSYAISAIGLICFLLTLFVPLTLSSSIILRFNQLVVVVAGFHLIYCYVLTVLRRRTGARWLLGGSLLFILTGFHDVLRSLSIIDNIALSGYGFLGLALAQAVLLARLYAKSFNDVEALSERLINLDRVKDEFLANTSHELKTPLNGIVGIADSLLANSATNVSQDVRGNLELIVSSGRRLTGIVNDLLDFSQLTQHELQLAQRPLDIHSVTDVLFDLFEASAKAKGLALINNIPTDFPMIYADETRLSQILSNLIANALKFTDQGSITVSVKAKSDMAVLAIKDTGIGIARDQQERIFESFTQVEGDSKRSYEGVGLGLSIVKRLTELHGGEVRLESTPGKGSCFYVSLPLASGTPQEASEPGILAIPRAASNTMPSMHSVVQPTVPADALRQQGQLLVVDDDAINMQVLCNYLLTQGYTLELAYDAQEALQAMRDGFKPDLVLMDLMMPGMTGIELTKQLRERFSPSDLPIIIITAKIRTNDAVVALEAGANDFLVKPVEREELLARIKTHLRVQQLVQEKLQLEHVAFVDTLTGIANRRRFERETKRLFDPESAALWPLTMLYIDLDKFKDVNDSYGHDVGDAVLIHTAECMRMSVRKGDVIARLGGDEFVALLIKTDLNAAESTRQRLLEALSQPFDTLGQQGLRIQASIGIALHPDDGENWQSLVKAADQAMYLEKQRRYESLKLAQD